MSRKKANPENAFAVFEQMLAEMKSNIEEMDRVLFELGSCFTPDRMAPKGPAEKAVGRGSSGTFSADAKPLEIAERRSCSSSSDQGASSFSRSNHYPRAGIS